MSSHNTKNSNEGVNVRRVTESPDPNAHLLERILSRNNMQRAWKRVKANKGVPGVDNMSIDEFPGFARKHWNAIRESLSDGSFKPLPVKRVEIPKPSGGTCPLGIPTVTDRLTHELFSERPMEMCPDFSHSNRYDHAAGVTKCQRTVGEHSFPNYGPVI